MPDWLKYTIAFLGPLTTTLSGAVVANGGHFDAVSVLLGLTAGFGGLLALGGNTSLKNKLENNSGPDA